VVAVGLVAARGRRVRGSRRATVSPRWG